MHGEERAIIDGWLSEAGGWYTDCTGLETKSARQALPCPITGGLVDVVRAGWSGKEWFGEGVVQYGPGDLVYVFR